MDITLGGEKCSNLRIFAGSKIDGKTEKLCRFEISLKDILARETTMPI